MEVQDEDTWKTERKKDLSINCKTNQFEKRNKNIRAKNIRASSDLGVEAVKNIHSSIGTNEPVVQNHMDFALIKYSSVSYTHLTLPTNREV